MSSIKHLIPLFNRILVKKFDPVLHSKRGILLPEDTKRRGVMKGTVVAVGNGKICEDGKQLPMSIQIGDVVLLPEYGGIPVQDDEKQEYFILKETEILAKFQTDDNVVDDDDINSI